MCNMTCSFHVPHVLHPPCASCYVSVVCRSNSCLSETRSPPFRRHPCTAWHPSVFSSLRDENLDTTFYGMTSINPPVSSHFTSQHFPSGEFHLAHGPMIPHCCLQRDAHSAEPCIGRKKKQAAKAPVAASSNAVKRCVTRVNIETECLQPCLFSVTVSIPALLAFSGRGEVGILPLPTRATEGI